MATETMSIFTRRRGFALLYLTGLIGASSGFTLEPQNARELPKKWNRASGSRQYVWDKPQLGRRSSAFRESSGDNPDPETSRSLPWNPTLRRIMTSVAGLGVGETAYLTYNKLAGTSGALCGTDGSCASVLTGPYSYVPFTDVPLAALGCAGYSLTVLLAILPVLLDDAEDSNNRIVLLTITTAMGTFSVYLMSLLTGVLHTWCPYCFASATISWILASCTWLGGCLPSEQEARKVGMQASAASFVATTAAALTLFVSVDDSYATNTMASSYPSSSSSSNEPTLLASSASSSPATSGQQSPRMSPPPITTTSSARAMALSQDLQSLQAKMYGAYWCSHCYDQKQTLGIEAFRNGVRYVECAKDGVNSEASMCKKRDVPGYPTWEIGGKLYPGEQELNELEDIVVQLSRKKQ